MTFEISNRFKKRCRLTYFLVCVPAFLFSQSLSYRNFTVDEGLPSSTIYASFQDSRGFMWFASDLGISKYDGYSFTNFTSGDGLPDNEVFNFLEDSSGRLWFRTLNGNVGYYKNGVFVNTTTDTTLRRLDSKSSICGMHEDGDGTIWICTFKDGVIAYRKDGKINRFFDDGKFKIINSFERIGEREFLLIAGYGIYRVKFNTAADSIAELDDYKFNLTPGLSYSKSVARSRDNVLFSDRGTIFEGDLKNRTFDIFMSEKTDSVYIYNLCQDDDFIWICTNTGALRYSKLQGRIVDNAWKDFKITSVTKDGEGNYWITTLGNGVLFCAFNSMYQYTTADGLLSNRIMSLAKDRRNRIWVGFESGIVNVIDRLAVRSQTITHKRFLNSCRVRKIYPFEDRVWFATSVGLYALEDDEIVFNWYNARDIVEYPKDSLWIGCSDRMYVVDRKTFDRFTDRVTTDPDHYKLGIGLWGTLKKERSKSIFHDSRGYVWLASEKNLYRAKSNSLKSIDPDKFNKNLNINDFDELKDQTLLIASNGGGLLFYKDGNYNSIDVKDGLSSGICNAVTADESIIWVATNKGLNRISGYPNKISIEYFNVYDGLLSNEIIDVVISNDTVWVATKRGLNFFRSDYTRRKTIQPRVHIENMMVNGQLISLVGDHDDLVFEHNENDVRINFLSPLYNSIGAVVYRYRLHATADWKYTKSPFIYLSALQSGEYDFTVEAKGRQGIWSSPASVSFVIKKPFYKSNLFLASTALFIILISVVAVKVYVANQKSKADMKQRVVVSELQTLRAQMNPHFLFNALNAIQDLFLNNDSKTAQHYIGKFGKLMRSLLNHSNNGSITIAEEMTTITDYLEIEQLRMNHRFKYTITIDPRIDVHTVEMPSMIIQPFIENSIWHGFTDAVIDAQLNIDLALENDDYVVISLRDNGIGRKRSGSIKKRKHHSRGIHLIMERIDILNFGNAKKISLSIHDLEDEQGNHPGTLVKIKIPLAV